MRDIMRPQLDIFVQYPEHQLGQELQQISKILGRHPEFNEWVHADLCQKAENCGDNGMTAEQILRAGILKQLRQVSYEELAFQLEDSSSSRAFLHLGHNECYGSSCLQENVSSIREETWNNVHETLLADSKSTGMETAKRVRTDSTVVASNIHHPTDSTLLYDCLRVLIRLFKAIRLAAGKPHWRMSIPIKEVKSLIFKIHNAKNDDERRPHYRKLLKISRKALQQLDELILRVEKVAWLMFCANLQKELDELTILRGSLEQIIYQADQRVIQGKKVPVEKKIVSIFEPHTDILVKDRRDTYFGHKVFLSSGASNLILDCQIPRGNPADSDMFMTCLDEVSRKCGRVPLQISTDGGFASQANVTSAKEKGVKDVCFAKRCGLEITDMVKSTWVYEKLRNWRAGIEGVISFLKRGYGLRLCNWHGFKGFCRYVKCAVVTYNLTLMARFEMST